MAITILVVDDESEFPELYKDYLSSFGHTVFTAGNVMDALVIFNQEHCDLVITDLVMPGRNGLDLVKDIRKRNSDIKIVMISAFMTDTQEESVKKVGVDFCLSKPLKLKELKDLISHIVSDKVKSQCVDRSDLQWTDLYNQSMSKETIPLSELIEALRTKNMQSRELDSLDTMICEWIDLVRNGSLDESITIQYVLTDKIFCLNIHNLPDAFYAENKGAWKYPMYLSKKIMNHVDYDANHKRLVLEKIIGA